MQDRDRIPVLAGVAQRLQRVDDPAHSREPLALMVEAVRQAAEDSGGRRLLERASSIRVIKGLWGYRNPALAIAEALGLGRVETALSVFGGNHVQLVLNRSAVEIQEGKREVVILAGAECGRTLGRAQKSGLDVEWLKGSESDAAPAPDVEYGDPSWTRHEAEMALGIQRPVQYYSLFEIALRHRRGEAPAEHLERISRLWARFSEVAAGNPNAWIRRPVSAEEIRTLSSSNRPISFPYPKLMNANMRVDMGAALILCSLATAKSLGIAQEKLVYPLSGADANDHYYVSERDNLFSSPAIRLVGARALELAAVEGSELDYVDLYSCFPSAVQVAAVELGLSQDRPLTVTGGSTFGGGPLNNTVMHAVARTVELLRERSGARALVTANGGMLTKHSLCVYGTESPEQGFRHRDLQAEVDATPRREVVADYRGLAEIESYTVMFGDGVAGLSTSYSAIYSQSGGSETAQAAAPTVAHLACRLPDGGRSWANLDDPEVLEAMCAEEFCGRSVRLDGRGGATI